MPREVLIPPRLVSTEDAAVYTGRSVGTIWRWASEGRIRRYGSGKSVRYDIDDLPRATKDVWGEWHLPPAPPLPEGARAA